MATLCFDCDQFPFVIHGIIKPNFGDESTCQEASSCHYQAVSSTNNEVCFEGC